MVIECWKPHKYKETLAIYVVSSLFIYDWIGNNIIDFILSAFLGVFIFYVTYVLIRKYRIPGIVRFRIVTVKLTEQLRNQYR